MFEVDMKKKEKYFQYQRVEQRREHFVNSHLASSFSLFFLRVCPSMRNKTREIKKSKLFFFHILIIFISVSFERRSVLNINRLKKDYIHNFNNES